MVANGTTVQPDFPIFLNPGAGRGAETEREKLAGAFQAVGAAPDIRVVPGAQMEQEVKAAMNAGATLIGAAGGDGTISCAANALVDSAATLLPIPLGTLNHFALRYGIPTIEAAAHAWARAQTVAIHVGSVNQRIFVNNASAGFYPHMVWHRDRMERVLPRMPAMWLAGMRVLFEFPMLQLDLMIGELKVAVRTPAMWVGIGRNSLRLPLPGDAEVLEPVLEVVYGHARTRRSVIALAVRLFRHLRRGLELKPADPKLEVLRARQFELHSRHHIDMALDGEDFRLNGPLHFAVRENALRILPLVAPAS